MWSCITEPSRESFVSAALNTWLEMIPEICSLSPASVWVFCSSYLHSAGWDHCCLKHSPATAWRVTSPDPPGGTNRTGSGLRCWTPFYSRCRDEEAIWEFLFSFLTTRERSWARPVNPNKRVPPLVPFNLLVRATQTHSASKESVDRWSGTSETANFSKIILDIIWKSGASFTLTLSVRICISDFWVQCETLKRIR